MMLQTTQKLQCIISKRLCVGTGLALNLQKDLQQRSEAPLLVYNRTASKAEPLVAAGAQA